MENSYEWKCTVNDMLSLYDMSSVPKQKTSCDKWSNLGQSKKKEKSKIFFIVTKFFILIKFPTF